MRIERGARGPAKGSRTARAGSPSGNGSAVVEAAVTVPPSDLEIILAGVKTLLRSRGTVSLPTAGLDLGFDAGVVARCRACGLSWHVSRSQYSSAGWWFCPSGCRPPRRDRHQQE